jgi:hypothetical protein
LLRIIKIVRYLIYKYQEFPYFQNKAIGRESSIVKRIRKRSVGFDKGNWVALGLESPGPPRPQLVFEK